MAPKKDRAYYMISIVAKRFDVHPQTLRLYEREGLLRPSRTEGNTRLYSDTDLETLSFILSLTRELGVNLLILETGCVSLRQMQAMIDAFLNGKPGLDPLIEAALAGRGTPAATGGGNGCSRGG